MNIIVGFSINGLGSKASHDNCGFKTLTHDFLFLNHTPLLNNQITAATAHLARFLVHDHRLGVG